MGTVETMRKFVGLPASQDLRKECFKRYAPEMDREKVPCMDDEIWYVCVKLLMIGQGVQSLDGTETGITIFVQSLHGNFQG